MARVCDPGRMEEVLVADREHGAADLAERMLDLAAALPPADAAAAAGRVAAAFPAMAPLGHLAVLLAGAAAGAAAGAGMDRLVADLRREHADGLRAVVAEAVAALDAASTVAVLSRSSTVLAVAAGLPGRRWLVSESLPGGEGARMAADLAGLRDAAGGKTAAEVVLLPDAELIGIVASARRGAVDAVLLGADAVAADGSIVNKTGSRALAEAARRAGLRCLAVADPWKRLPPGSRPVVGGLFEILPADLVETIG